jgi:hypothetical protein
VTKGLQGKKGIFYLLISALLSTQNSVYGPVMCVNLLGGKDAEKMLSVAYEEYIVLYSLKVGFFYNFILRGNLLNSA